MHFGIISPPVPGHIHPFGALGRELIARGHRVTLIHMADVSSRAVAEDLEFIAIGQSDHPAGTLPRSLAKLGTLDGLSALRFTIGEIRNTTRMMLRDTPEKLAHAGVGALLVDQTEPAGGTIAEHLGIPFVTVCNALAINREPRVPPAFSGWTYRKGAVAALRNRAGYFVSDRVLSPVTSMVAEYRRRWNLPASRNPEHSFSPLAQISQQAPAFDYPRAHLPRTFHYTGPLRRPGAQVDFPWERLDGRPLIYASLGTLQNGKERVFRTFAEACLGLEVQLVITHGGGLDDSVAASFPGKPIVVSYAPQLAVLRRARLTLTHAGLNTVLDSLSCGVPLVSVPITYEQPAIGRRIEWCGAGQTIGFRALSTARVRRAICDVLGDPGFREKACQVQQSILAAGGVLRAADIVEQALEF
jgi:zeaxanthin glucosyltransferase